MTAVLTLLIVLVLSLVVTRGATIALTATGLSREAARFQSRSAFSGAGFTTSESESVVRHPVRRRIIMWLMLAGNAGIIAVVASVVLAATSPEGDLGTLVQVLLILGLIAFVWWASRLDRVDRWITSLATMALRRYTTLDTRDYASLLHVGGDYIITELQVTPDNWMAGRDIDSMALRKEGVVILGIERAGGTYFGAPTRDTVIEAGDVVVLYGAGDSIKAVDERQRGAEGDAEHDDAVRAHHGDEEPD